MGKFKQLVNKLMLEGKSETAARKAAAGMRKARKNK